MCGTQATATGTSLVVLMALTELGFARLGFQPSSTLWE